jgi:K+-sensing histidine kinase KdpD
MKEEVKRLREMLSTAGAALQTLSAGMVHARVNSMSYKASDFMEDVRKRFESRLPEKTSTIEWRIDVGETALDLDPQLLPLVVEELIENALRFGDGSDLKIDAGVENGNLILTLSEPKATFDHDLSKWGREPLKNMSHGHYGLGLNRARIIVESHGGKLEAKYDQTARNLVTRITLPALPPTG